MALVFYCQGKALPSRCYEGTQTSKSVRTSHRPVFRAYDKTYLITTNHRLEALCVLVSNLAPDDVFVISPVNKGVDFSVFIVTKQDSPLDTFAEKNARMFPKYIGLTFRFFR